MDPSNPEHAEALSLALKRLKRSDAFESELVRLLERKSISASAKDAVLHHLRSKGVLNDKRAAENLARHLQSRSKGVEKLRSELLKRGAPGEIVETCLASQGPEQQRSAAVSLLEKRAAAVNTRAKAGRLLHSRGFAEDLIERVLDEKFPFQDD